MKKGDFLIIAVVAIMIISWMMMSREGSSAAIYVDGELYKNVPLSENTQVTVASEFGKNTIVVDGGRVRIINSDCPNKDCENGEISRGARSLVCLPNRLTVIIEDEKTKDETDVIL